MKRIIVLLMFLVSLPSYALNAKLDPAVSIVEACLKNEGVLLCNDEVNSILETVSLDARGEFVYYLKDLLNKNETELVIVNLYTKLQNLVPMYEKIDGCTEWSCRDIKIFLGDVSTRYVKVTPVDAELYKELYKKQAVQSGRYALLTTLSDKASKVTTVKEMDQMISFAEFAKNYSRDIKDEYYLYQAGVAIIRDMTLKALKLRPGHEGIYKISFDNEEVNKTLKIDSVVVMESNDRDALVVNFVSSKSRIVKVAFKQAGLLGNTLFSNEDVYNNDNNQEVQSPFFKFELDRNTNSIKGVFNSARYGKSSFTGELVKSNLEVYEQSNDLLASVASVEGKYALQVGSYKLNLVISKRTDDRSLFEAYLVSPNALLTFSKVTLDNKTGVLSLVDSRNERKLTIGFLGDKTIKGVFINGPLAQVLEVNSL